MREEQIIIRLREKENAGLGRIFKELRKKTYLSTKADFPIFKGIIVTLSKNGHKIPDYQIRRHFNNINTEDYDSSEKLELLKDIKETNLSVFINKGPKESSKTHQKSTTFNVYTSVDTLYPIGKSTVIN
jgi:hypothetical protein